MYTPIIDTPELVTTGLPFKRLRLSGFGLMVDQDVMIKIPLGSHIFYALNCGGWGSGEEMPSWYSST